jgi:hypothetical protein
VPPGFSVSLEEPERPSMANPDFSNDCTILLLHRVNDRRNIVHPGLICLTNLLDNKSDWPSDSRTKGQSGHQVKATG